tara:strand:- start:225 stop:458 length:234 start_codon:yes stop_codon:yes gene_type:complete
MFSGSWLEECFSLWLAFFIAFSLSRAEILGRPWSVLAHGESETAEGELIDADGGLGEKWGNVMGCVVLRALWACMAL